MMARNQATLVTMLFVAASAGLLHSLMHAGEGVFPGQHWSSRPPASVGLRAEKLEELAAFVGGRGCVVRHGYLTFSWGDPGRSSDVASAFKPLLSTLLLIAIQEGKLSGVDAPVADVEPRLLALNNGKDAIMTWRHLASQTSGYGFSERPGEAYAYNDFALALYYDTLTAGVFRQSADEILRTRLAEPLQFEDRHTFEAFGPRDRPGRLALSCRDFARFGLLYLRGGRWNGRQLLASNLIHLATAEPLPAHTPRTRGVEKLMLPNQRSIGGSRNITPVGPGYYSFNWWLNGTNQSGHRLLVEAPKDTLLASGHGGRRALWIIPSLDLVVCWNESSIDDHDASPGNRNSRCNQAARLMVEATVPGTR